MTRLTREWVKKAEADFHSARRELRARQALNLDSACFHAQQSAEKYLKARLQEADIEFPKTHDLTMLLDLVIAVEPLWEGTRDGLDQLNAYAVRFRYPGCDATREHAKEAFGICRQVRQLVRSSLGLRG